MQKLQVGEHLFGQKGTGISDGARLEYTKSGLMLVVHAKNPLQKEIESFSKKRVDLALYEKGQVIWFLFKIQGSLSWSDCPFSIKLNKDPYIIDNFPRHLPGDQGLGLHMILVESSSGIIKAMRLVGLENRFSQEFCNMLQRQVESAFDLEKYVQEIKQVFSNFTPKQLVNYANARTYTPGK